jgi:hypothetical protein
MLPLNWEDQGTITIPIEGLRLQPIQDPDSKFEIEEGAIALRKAQLRLCEEKLSICAKPGLIYDNRKGFNDTKCYRNCSMRRDTDSRSSEDHPPPT